MTNTLKFKNKKAPLQLKGTYSDTNKQFNIIAYNTNNVIIMLYYYHIINY